MNSNSNSPEKTNPNSERQTVGTVYTPVSFRVDDITTVNGDVNYTRTSSPSPNLVGNPRNDDDMSDLEAVLSPLFERILTIEKQKVPQISARLSKLEEHMNDPKQKTRLLMTAIMDENGVILESEQKRDDTIVALLETVVAQGESRESRINVYLEKLRELNRLIQNSDAPTSEVRSSVIKLSQNSAFSGLKDQPSNEIMEKLEQVIELMTFYMFVLNRRDLFVFDDHQTDPEVLNNIIKLLNTELEKIKNEDYGLINKPNENLQFWGKIIMALALGILIVLSAVVLVNMLGFAVPTVLIPYLAAIQASNLVSTILNFVTAKLAVDLNTAAVVTTVATAGTLGLFGKTLHYAGAPNTFKPDLDAAIHSIQSHPVLAPRPA